MTVSTDNVEGLRYAIKFLPDLIISFKAFPNLDINGFMLKKKTLGAIRDIPLFLLGDFAPAELLKFKMEKVQAFISTPINPVALLERVNIFFNYKLDSDNSRTPMLLDMYVRGNIINVQIEGNLEPSKLEVFNFLLRSFCIQKEVFRPKIFIIVPSLYPESITRENVELLFKFLDFPEIKINQQSVKILTGVDPLRISIKRHKVFRQFEVVKSYIEGIQSLQIDFDKEKKIPVDFLKVDNTYIYDLYDKEGHRMIPAMTRVTREMLDKIKEKNLSFLSYFSDKNMSIAIDPPTSSDPEDMLLLEDDDFLLNLITEEFQPIETELNSIQIVDEKQSLFFRKMKGHDVLVITRERDFVRFIVSTLEVYFSFSYASNGGNIDKLISDKCYTIVFIDSDVAEPDAYEILRRIRSTTSRRKTSVIILARKINKTAVIKYRKYGTDNIILSPFSSSQIQSKVFQSVLADRKT